MSKRTKKNIYHHLAPSWCYKSHNHTQAACNIIGPHFVQTQTPKLWLCSQDSHRRFPLSSVLGLWRWTWRLIVLPQKCFLFWTPVIPFLAFLLKQFSLSASPCHRKSPRRRVRSELMGVSFLPHSSLQLPPQMMTLGRRVDWKQCGFIKAALLSASLSQISV